MTWSPDASAATDTRAYRPLSTSSRAARRATAALNRSLDARFGARRAESIVPREASPRRPR